MLIFFEGFPSIFLLSFIIWSAKSCTKCCQNLFFQFNFFPHNVHKLMIYLNFKYFRHLNILCDFIVFYVIYSLRVYAFSIGPSLTFAPFSVRDFFLETKCHHTANMPLIYLNGLSFQDDFFFFFVNLFD